MADQIPFDEDRLNMLFEEALKSANEDDPFKVGESFLRVFPEYELRPGETTEILGRRLIQTRKDIGASIPPEFTHTVEKIVQEAMSVADSDDPKDIGEAFLRAFPDYDRMGKTVEQIGQEIQEERDSLRQQLLNKQMESWLNSRRN